MQIKLADALLRRKELGEKLQMLRQIKDTSMFYAIRGKRVPVTEGIEQIDIDYPKLEVSQVIAEYDFVARQLRLIDAVIQQANWNTPIDVDPMTMDVYRAPSKEAA